MIPVWAHWCLLVSNTCLTTAYTVMMIGMGEHPSAAWNAAFGIVLWAVPTIVHVATKGRASKGESPQPQCAMMRVCGRHDGEPCASCEIMTSSAPRRRA